MIKRFFSLALCMAICVQIFSVPAYAAEVYPYDEDAVAGIEFPGFYFPDEDRIIMFEDAVAPLSLTLVSGTMAITGAMLLCMMYFKILTSENNRVASRALAQMMSDVLSNASDACVSFCSQVGEMFIKGKAISESLLRSGADYITELKEAVVTLTQEQSPDFSFTKGSAGSLNYTVNSDLYSFNANAGYDSTNKMITMPWLFASMVGASFYCRARYLYRGSSTIYYFWHGLGADEYGKYWYFFRSSSMYGFSTDNITPASTISVPDNVNVTKFYLSSKAAYDAALGENATQYFLNANSIIRNYSVKSGTSSFSYYGPSVSYYDYNGGLKDAVDVAVLGSYFAYSGCFGRTTEQVGIDVIVEDTDTPSYVAIPDGLVLDNAATEDGIDIEALAYRIAAILASRLAGTEKADAAEEEKQGILQNILQTVISIPSDIAVGLSDVLRGAVKEVEQLAPVQAVQAKFAAIAIIYNVVDGFLKKITDDITPPIIYVDMTKSKSATIMSDNDQIPILDMSFYEPYKPYGDLILSGILWTFFLWRLWMRAPDIISGAGMVIIDGTKISNFQTDDKKKGAQKK